MIGGSARATHIFYNERFDSAKRKRGAQRKVDTCSETMKSLGARLWRGIVGAMLAMIGASASGLTLGQFDRTMKIMDSGKTMLVDAMLGWDSNTQAYIG